MCLVLAACGGAAVKPAPRPRSEEDVFTERARDRLHAADPSLAVTIARPLTLEIVVKGGGKSTVTLDRWLASCRADRDRCEAALDDLVKGTIDITRHMGEAPRAEQLHAVVRPTAYLRAAAQTAGALATAPFAGDVSVALVFDLPRGVRFVTKHDLDALGLSFAAARDQALAHDDAELGPLDAQIKALPERGLGYISTGSFYEASRILQTTQWAKVAASLHGPLLVATPAQDMVLYGEQKGPEVVEVMRAITGDMAAKSARPLSTQVLRWTPNGWEVAAP